jgi:GMP synthase (glutamine-hydrolysing)
MQSEPSWLDQPVTDMASAHAEALPERAHLRFILVQARTADDPARSHEHACFAARLGVSPNQIDCVSIFEEELSELDLTGAHGVLVGGAGQYSVLDELDPVRDFVAYTAWLASSHQTASLPVFASCFGFQAMVMGLGGEVIADEPSAEVGSYTLYLKPEGASDPLFGSLPERFTAQLGHKDRATGVPEGLFDIAGSERSPFQAVRVCGRPQFATQFHPELAAADNRHRFLRYMDEYGKLFGKEAAQERLNSHSPSPEANALLDRFVTEYVMPFASGRGA